MLVEVDRGLWTAEGPQVFAGMALGSRMTVVREPDGGLILHSPVVLGEALERELRDLGEVRSLIAPNLYHHSHVAAYLARFPGSVLYGCPRLGSRRSELAIRSTLGVAPDPWPETLEHLWIRGNPVHEEVVAFHRASRSLLVADLVGNMTRMRVLRMRAFGLPNGWGRFGAPRMLRLMMRDRAAARRSVQALLEWPFERVIVTHGEVLGEGGRERVAEGFSWLLDG